MMKNLPRLLFLALAATLAAAVEPQNADEKVVKSEMDRLTIAFKKGDMRTILEKTYPPLLEKMGGKEVAIKQVETFMKSPGMKGYTVESYAAEEPFIFLESETRRFVIIPVKTVMTYPKGKVRSNTFMLGILPAGSKEWTFVDGSKLNSALMKNLLPDFPKSVTLPKIDFQVVPDKLPEDSKKVKPAADSNP
jgi:hypothetical protein